MRRCETCGGKVGPFEARQRNPKTGAKECGRCRAPQPRVAASGFVNLHDHTWGEGVDGDVLLRPGRYKVAAVDEYGTWVEHEGTKVVLGETHVASEDYPMLEQILVERPPLEREGARKGAADLSPLLPSAPRFEETSNPNYPGVILIKHPSSGSLLGRIRSNGSGVWTVEREPWVGWLRGVAEGNGNTYSSQQEAQGYVTRAWQRSAEDESSREQELMLYTESMRKGAPFAGYEDFDACVAANQDKGDPEAYCGKIKHEVEGTRKTAWPWSQDESGIWIINDYGERKEGPFKSRMEALKRLAAWNIQGDFYRLSFVAQHKHAHDSGDGETIFHCPFCGSGNVSGRSDGTVECAYCHSTFTVQVQPSNPNMPQTVNGEPYDIPGMPGQIDKPQPGDGSAPSPDAPPAGDTEGDNPGPEIGEDAGENPFAKDTDEDTDEDKNPFAKGSARYITAEGIALPEDEYVRYLATKHARR